MGRKSRLIITSGPTFPSRSLNASSTNASGRVDRIGSSIFSNPEILHPVEALPRDALNQVSPRALWTMVEGGLS
jgi:hypothetical protein